MKYEYQSPVCKSLTVVAAGRLCAVSDTANAREQVSLSGMSGSWNPED